MTNAKAWVAAIFAGIAAGLAALGTALVGDQTLSELTDAQWIAVATAVVTSFGGAFGLTWSVTNRVAPVAASVLPVSYASVNAWGDGDLGTVSKKLATDANNWDVRITDALKD